MAEVNNNYGTIEEQFGRIRDYVIREKDPINLLNGYSKLEDIDNRFKEEKNFFYAMCTLLQAVAKGIFKKKEEFISFIFSFGQDNFSTFLNNEQIDAQDKFSVLVTKYAIISQLPDEFKDIRDKEMDLLYKHIENVSKDYAKYIEDDRLSQDVLMDNYILLNSLSAIINNIFSNNSKTDYNKDIKFIIDIYKNIPFLTKDRIINFQGEPGFNRILHEFLTKPCKSSDMFNFYKYFSKNHPSCIYKFATTSDPTNRRYKLIEENKDFSGNFICNFPDVLSENGKIRCGESRCQYNVLSEILYTLNYKEVPEDVKEDIKQMLNITLESLSDHIKSLKESNNLEELQKINYLLNCPIKDPNNGEIATPMDLINSLIEKRVINLSDEQMEQFRTEPVCLKTVEEIKNSIEYKKAVAKKQKEEKMKETQISLNEYRTMEEIFTPEVLQREAIEKQFNVIKDYIIGEKDPENLLLGYDKLDISNDLKIQTESSTGRIINRILFSPISVEAFPFLNNENIKNKFINFIFNTGQNNFNTFLNDEQINVQDKFSALITKYLIISNLPEEFIEVKNEEMDLLYNHIKEVSKDYTKYIETEKIDVFKDNFFIFSNSLQIITNNILFEENKTNYDKDIRFITDIYQSLPILTKDRIINFQGQPSFNILLQKFLENPHKNDDIIDFFKNTIQNDPSCIYKFATTMDDINHKYEQIEQIGDFSGNFICNFPDVLSENGKIRCEETRCRYNVLSDILYNLNYVEIPEDVKEDVKQMLNIALKSLSNHIKSLRDNENIEELQKINYLLNCPIKDPNTKEIVTPMDLINSLKERGVINLIEEQMEQFRTEPVYLQTVEEVKNSIEFKEAVVKKQKEERDEADNRETIKGNKEIKKLQNDLETEEQKTKASRIYKFYNFFSKIFLKRETKYRTKSEILAEKKLNEKIIELSRPFFSLATKATEKQIQTLNQNISKEQTRGTEINSSKSIENHAM